MEYVVTIQRSELDRPGRLVAVSALPTPDLRSHCPLPEVRMLARLARAVSTTSAIQMLPLLLRCNRDLPRTTGCKKNWLSGTTNLVFAPNRSPRGE